jgi:hypothetical protein
MESGSDVLLSQYRTEALSECVDVACEDIADEPKDVEGDDERLAAGLQSVNRSRLDGIVEIDEAIDVVVYHNHVLGPASHTVKRGVARRMIGCRTEKFAYSRPNARTNSVVHWVGHDLL